MKILKKSMSIISCILVVLLVFSSVPMVAFAQGETLKVTRSKIGGNADWDNRIIDRFTASDGMAMFCINASNTTTSDSVIYTNQGVLTSCSSAGTDYNPSANYIYSIIYWATASQNDGGKGWNLKSLSDIQYASIRIAIKFNNPSNWSSSTKTNIQAVIKNAKDLKSMAATKQKTQKTAQLSFTGKVVDNGGYVDASGRYIISKYKLSGNADSYTTIAESDNNAKYIKDVNTFTFYKDTINNASDYCADYSFHAKRTNSALYKYTYSGLQTLCRFEIEKFEDDLGYRKIADTPKGELTIIKKDEDNARLLAGAVFELKNKSTGVVFGEKKTDQNGKAKFLEIPIGEYLLTETVAPTGYTIPSENNPRTIVITEKNSNQTIDITNPQAPGVLKISKIAYDEASNIINSINTKFVITNTVTNNSVTVKTNTVESGGMTSRTIYLPAYDANKNIIEYEIKEIVEERYDCTPQSKKISLTPNVTSVVDFNNVVKTGTLTIKKEVDAGTPQGLGFTVKSYGWFSGAYKEYKNYGELTIDNVDGTVSLINLPVYDEGNQFIRYTVEETNNINKDNVTFIPAGIKTVFLKPHEEADNRISFDTTIGIKNTQVKKYGSISVKKAFPDGTPYDLSGYNFTLFYGEDYLDTATTNSEGVAIFENVLKVEGGTKQYVIAEAFEFNAQKCPRIEVSNSIQIPADSIIVDQTLDAGTLNNYSRRATLQIVKDSEDDKYENVKFKVTPIENSVYPQGTFFIVTTNEFGIALLENLIIYDDNNNFIRYKVEEVIKEEDENKYVLPPVQTIIFDGLYSLNEPGRYSESTVIRAAKKKVLVFENKLKSGSITIRKSADDNVVKDILFTISSSDPTFTDLEVKTDETGTCVIENLPIYSAADNYARPITYTITEHTELRYIPVTAKSTTLNYKISESHLNEENAALILFENKLRLGGIEILKNSDDGIRAGFEFTIADTLGNEYFLTTNEDGYTSIDNLRIYDENNEKIQYTVKEIPNVNYAIIPNEVVTLIENDYVSVSFYNQHKKFSINFKKIDSITLKSQAQNEYMSLEGASYGLYKDGNLINTYSTDENGEFVTEYFDCELGYTIKEISPSKGYKLSEEEIFVPSAPEYYEDITNVFTIYGQETPISQALIIEKRDSETAKLIKASAGFKVYLAGAKKPLSTTMTINGETTVVDTFYTVDGVLKLPFDLYYGKYYLYEASAPTGYVASELPIEFTVSAEPLAPIVVDNTPERATIFVRKYSSTVVPESFTSTQNYNLPNGETIKVNLVKYSEESVALEGAEFKVFANEDIFENEEKIYSKGDEVAHLTTGQNGLSEETKPLPLGRYEVTEVKAPKGYALPLPHLKSKVVTLNHNEDPMVTKVKASVSFSDERQALRLDFTKILKTPENKKLAIDITEAEKNVFFGLYQKVANGEDVLAQVIPVSFTKPDITIEKSIPFGSYYLKEICTDSRYKLDNKTYPVEYFGDLSGKSAIDADVGEIVNELVHPIVKIVKVDKENTEIKLSGAHFAIYNDVNGKPGEVVDEFTSSEQGIYECKTLIKGKYFVKETVAPMGYVLDPRFYPLDITGDEIVDSGIIYVSNVASGDYFVNTPQDHSLKIIKKTEVGSPKGFEFTVTGVDGTSFSETYTTDENGVIVIDDLTRGSYIVVEKENEFTIRYVLPDAQTFIIDDSTEPETVLTFVNKLIRGNVLIHKVDKDKIAVSGAKFTVYDENGKAVATATSDKNGEARITGLAQGEYIIKETSAPYGYVLGTEEVPVNITYDGETKEVTIVNDKVVTPEPNPYTGGCCMAYGLDSSLAGLIAMASFVLVMFRKKKSRK